MAKILYEENMNYGIHCGKAVWATDMIHDVYQSSHLKLKDVDFAIETENCVILVEYKNANIKGAKKKREFAPESDDVIASVVQKFFDSLHYLNLIGKQKPVRYVYILEWPGGDSRMRKRLRNYIKKTLPFELQKQLNAGKKLIETFDIVSIDEWNRDNLYGQFPCLPVTV